MLTGVTGKTGGATARALVAKGAKLRALVRDETKAAELKEMGVELVVGDMADKASVQRALDGVEKATLILPNSEQQQSMEMQFVDLAGEARVGHIVKLSSFEALPDADSPVPKLHYAVEQHIKNSGLAWTMIRPNFFMQNLLGAGATIKAQQKFFLPLGQGKTVMVDCRDIGAAFAEVLTGNGHENQSYEIFGPEVLSFSDVADRFSEVLGEKIEYVDMPADAYRDVLAPFLTSEWHLNAVCHLFSKIAAGAVPVYTSDTFKKLVGRDPISLAQFIRDHIAVYQD